MTAPHHLYQLPVCPDQPSTPNSQNTSFVINRKSNSTPTHSSQYSSCHQSTTIPSLNSNTILYFLCITRVRIYTTFIHPYTINCLQPTSTKFDGCFNVFLTVPVLSTCHFVRTSFPKSLEIIRPVFCMLNGCFWHRTSQKWFATQSITRIFVFDKSVLTGMKALHHDPSLISAFCSCEQWHF